jgi:hypothetical protein
VVDLEVRKEVRNMHHARTSSVGLFLD